MIYSIISVLIFRWSLKLCYIEIRRIKKLCVDDVNSFGYTIFVRSVSQFYVQLFFLLINLYFFCTYTQCKAGLTQVSYLTETQSKLLNRVLNCV
jgi:hypothetical protein